MKKESCSALLFFVPSFYVNLKIRFYDLHKKLIFFLQFFIPNDIIVTFAVDWFTNRIYRSVMLILLVET